jgi:hypothetical protein
MYAGHFALGLAIKAKEPRAPTLGILLGTGLLDILFGPFVLLGIERVTMTPGKGPGFTLDFIDWSHSLAMALGWSAAYALFFVRRGAAVAWAMGFAVFSHFLLDLPMHPHDMALWPYARTHLGFGLWDTPYWWWIELACVVLGCGYYVRRARAGDSFGRYAGWAVAIVLALHLLNSPWLSPSR